MPQKPYEYCETVFLHRTLHGSYKKESQLFFNDLRFGLLGLDPNEKQYAFSYELKSTIQGLEVIEVPKNRGDMKKLVSALWERVLGN